MTVSVTSIVRGNTSAAGAQANITSSYNTGLSPDGTKLLFVSDATNLVAGDTNGAIDVFIKDLTTGAVQCVNSTPAGTIGDNGSYSANFSADGAKVVFISSASNLIAGDTNGVADVYIKTLSTGAIERVSVSAAGAQINAAAAAPVLSPDGTKVAFFTGATNLVAGDANGVADIFVKNLSTGAVERVNLTAAGAEAAGGASTWPVFSPDGTRIAFISAASNLVAGDTNGVDDVFIKTLSTGAIERVNTSAAGVQGNNPADAPAFSPDGAKIAFYSSASNLVAGDGNGLSDVFVKNLTTGAIERVNTSASGAEATGALSRYPTFSPDGTLVAFESGAANLVAGDTNGAYDIFVKNLNTGEINRVSVAPANLQGDQGSHFPAFGPGGGKLSFRSYATNLVAGDTNGVDDIFVVEVVGVSGPPGIAVASSAATAANPVAQATLVAASAPDSLAGDDRDNTIFAGAGADTAWGGSGRDTLWGEEGDDLLFGNGEADRLWGWSGADTLGGGPGDDSLGGGPGADQLRGGQGADQMFGGQGADSLWGGRGDDSLMGGLGADQFFVSAEAGADEIRDFHFAEGDRLVAPVGAHWTVAAAEDGGAWIRFDGPSLHLIGVAPSAVTSDWMLFV